MNILEKWRCAGEYESLLRILTEFIDAIYAAAFALFPPVQKGTSRGHPEFSIKFTL